MTALLIILIILLIICFVILLIILNRTNEQGRLTEELYDRLRNVSKDISNLHSQIIKQDNTVKSKQDTPVEEKKIFKKPPEIKIETEPVHIYEPPPIVNEKKEPDPVFRKTAFTPKPEQSWKEKNSDLEKFIGENLANKIGIAILVLGIGFFVKYAIDRNWINESGRVLIGLVAGALLIGIAHFIRNSYRSFSSVLMGGGLAVFYFTIAFAFHEYQLIGQQAAFIIMVGVTAFAVALSLFYDRQELAILSIIGGFITPFLVSTGQDNYIALFIYLCILNSGMVVLAWFKRWPAINSICIFFTTIIYGSWLIDRVFFESGATFPYKDAMLFATIFYVLFVIMNIVNSIRLKIKFTGFDFSMVLSTNFIYYAGGMVILSYWNDAQYQGLFTFLIGLFNLVLTIYFYPRRSVDRTFASLLLALSITFISLAVPVQLDGNRITLFWCAEMLLLFWLFQRTRIKQFKIAASAMVVLMLTSLFVTWAQEYFNGDELMPIIINKAFITTIIAAISLLCGHFLMRKEADSFFYKGLTNKTVRDLLLITSCIILYLSGLLELFYQFGTRINISNLSTIYLQAYTFAFAIITGIIFRNTQQATLLRFFLATASFTIYILSLSTNNELSRQLTITPYKSHFIVHWISILLLIWLWFDTIRLFRANNSNWSTYSGTFTAIASALIIFVLSIELYHAMYWISYDHAAGWEWWENLYYKAGLSILWGLCSFTMMWLGMKHSYRLLRIYSLSLFTLTLAKLFFFDIKNIPPGGKIAAFIMLGILLLTISFMYQRLKKMIIEDPIV